MRHGGTIRDGGRADARRWDARLRDAFAAVAEQIATAADPAQLLRSTLVTGAGLLEPPAHAGAAALADDRGALHVVAASGDDDVSAGLTRLVGGDGPWRDSLTSSAPVGVGDLSLLRSRAPAAAETVAAWSARGFRSVLAVPVRLRDEAVGSLTLLSTRPGETPPADLAALQAVVDVAATGLLQQRLVRAARTLPEPLRRTLQDRGR